MIITIFAKLKKSATSGKAGGLAKGERLKAARPFGRQGGRLPCDRGRSGHSLPVRDEWGDCLREGWLRSQPVPPLPNPLLLPSSGREGVRQSAWLGRRSRNCQTLGVSPAKLEDLNFINDLATVDEDEQFCLP